MKIAKALDFIKERNGKIFSVRFTKRTDGTLREMVCRQGVKSHLVENPTKEGLNFEAHGLIPVFDMQTNAYRSFGIECLKEIKINGVWKKVTYPKVPA